MTVIKYECKLCDSFHIPFEIDKFCKECGFNTDLIECDNVIYCATNYEEDFIKVVFD